VEVGELARAAEALERAGAAERIISRQTSEAALDQGLPAEQSLLLATEHALVRAVAGRIADGVQNTAPRASEMLQQIDEPITEAASALDAVVGGPVESSKPALAKASRAAEVVGQQLVKAAAALRKALGQAGDQLARLAAVQLDSATLARRAVADASPAFASAAEDLMSLGEAQKTIQEAWIEQSKAEGRQAWGVALATSRALEDLRQMQRWADQVAVELSRGRADSRWLRKCRRNWLSR
jgi:hypothetical protein